MSEIDLEKIKKEPLEKKIILLRQLKNDLIGCFDFKQIYFSKGVIEILLNMLPTE